ncbi:MAG: phage replisome organizer N-terminal domain-containing protein [Clostridia bacterium]|nr:phage replisome organizer N-terminal domain-containing protein [Clostridia bacterium]
MISWIKLDTAIFRNNKVMALLNGKNGERMVLNYIRFLCLAGDLNSSGVFVLDDGSPMSAQTLASYLGITYQTLIKSTKRLLEVGLLTTDENGCYMIPNWEYHQNAEALRKMRDAERKRKARARKKRELADAEALENLPEDDKDRPRTRPQKNGTSPHTETDKEKETEKDLVFLSDERKTGTRCLSAFDTDEEDEEDDEEIRAYKQENTKWRNNAEYVSSSGHGLVKMTQRQYEDLLDRMDPDVLEEYIDKLGAYLEKTGQRSTRAYKVILEWFYKDIALDPNKDFIKTL